MSWLSEWVRKVIGKPKPKPPAKKPKLPPKVVPKKHPPTPIPNISPSAMQARGLAAFNAQRASLGLYPYWLDDGLNAAAAELAPGMADGTLEAHAGFPDRIRRHVPYAAIDEGCSEGGRTPEECVMILDSVDDAHRADFRSTVYNRVGIAYSLTTAGQYLPYGGFCLVVDYGAA